MNCMMGKSGLFPGIIANLPIRRSSHASSGDPPAFYSAPSSVQVNTAWVASTHHCPNHVLLSNKAQGENYICKHYTVTNSTVNKLIKSTNITFQRFTCSSTLISGYNDNKEFGMYVSTLAMCKLRVRTCSQRHACQKRELHCIFIQLNL
jgi:hypothetical protein